MDTMMKKFLFGLLICTTGVTGHGLLYGQKADEPKGDQTPLALPGHSAHGEIFNQGPRQKAYLMEGMPRIDFPVTSKNPLVQKFIEQGIGQLHGYWYFEAERSFRQAAKLDPDCAIAYWGMALANEENTKRSKGFIKEAVQRKSKASKRERLYIEAINNYLNASGAEAGKKNQNIVKAFEGIVKEFPDDLEAQAFLAHYMYKFRGNINKSHDQVDAVIQKILDKNPLHPVHHYRIHLWDYKTPKRALGSAAQGGPSGPGIAHLWHMPGHIYSDLKRYEDAVWQQEASSRVDHKYMMKNLVLPDQIHNYAHNQEWYIRNLIYLGKHKDALALAKNLVEIPRHPKHNAEQGRHSFFYGRLRLFEILSRFELWDETIALAKTPYLDPTSMEAEQVKRLRQLGIAHVRTGKVKEAEQVLAELEQRLSKFQDNKDEKPQPSNTKNGPDKVLPTNKSGINNNPDGEAKVIIVPDDSGKKPKSADPQGKPGKGKGSAGKKLPSPVQQALQQAIHAIHGHQAYLSCDYQTALDLMRKAGEDGLAIARLQCLAGDTKGAIAAVQGQVKNSDKQVLPLVTLVEVLWMADKKKEAADAFKQLRDLSGSIQFDSPVFARLGPIARELGLPADWRVASTPATDLGPRPKLETLGSFTWQPGLAPKWNLLDVAGHSVSLDKFRGKPVIVIFYLGHGCLHCTEQLTAFAAQAEQFKKAGIELVAISTDDQDGLKVALKSCKDGKFAFPLLANPKLDVFKLYRAYDDFEETPLHGTFLIDSTGLLRWMDISFEPFMDVNFMLKESQRLLSFPEVNCCD
jgi:peroxiredoxin/tetratricopeptide (TPR) repeat protein